ncbi:MAG: extracellular solute-binding protein family 1 [Acidimicrobiaceae bacterium]|nr:extracellular solute-binding protein family 1 [Acidimicrobiaceae bacterium]
MSQRKQHEITAGDKGRSRGRLSGMFGACLLFSTLSVASVSLNGSSSSPKVAAKTHAPVTLTYMLWDPNQEVGYKQSIAQFEKKYPYIHVNVEQVTGAAYWQKLTTSIAGGNAPDLFWDNSSYFPTFLKDGGLLSVDQFIKSNNVNLSDYYSSLLPLFKSGGHYYGLTKDWDTVAMIFNKTMLNKAGLAQPANLTWNPTTGGTLLKYAEDLTLDSSGKHAGQPGFDPNHIVQYGFSPNLAGGSWQTGYGNFLAEAGVTYFKNGKWQYATPTAVQVFTFLNNLVYKWHVAPPATVTASPTYNAVTDSFASGKVAMYMDGDWDLSTIASSVKFPWGIAPLPSGPKGRVSVTNGLGINVYSHTKNPQAAGLLWAWLTNKSTQSLMSSEGYVWGSMPSVDSLFVKYWSGKGLNVSPFLEEEKGRTVLGVEALNFAPAWSAASAELNLVFLKNVPVKTGVYASVQAGNAALGG